MTRAKPWTTLVLCRVFCFVYCPESNVGKGCGTNGQLQSISYRLKQTVPNSLDTTIALFRNHWTSFSLFPAFHHINSVDRSFPGSRYPHFCQRGRHQDFSSTQNIHNCNTVHLHHSTHSHNGGHLPIVLEVTLSGLSRTKCVAPLHHHYNFHSRTRSNHQAPSSTSEAGREEKRECFELHGKQQWCLLGDRDHIQIRP